MPVRHALRLSLAMLFAVCPLAAPVSTVASANAASVEACAPCEAGEQISSGLRRLHLVRPDLIPYPVAFEVHC